MASCRYVVVLLFFATMAAGRTTDVIDKANNLSRKEKFLALLRFQFGTTSCNAGNDEGICYTARECTAVRGRAVGTCAQGFGVCCLVELSCRASTSQRVAYFVNPGYPQASTNSGACDMKLEVSDRSICQVRLDLLQFNLASPETTGPNIGTCQRDRFFIRSPFSSVLGFQSLCGNNSGQHLYIPVDTSQGTDSLSLMFDTTSDMAHSWRIKMTQIPCNSEMAAPTGCLQFFTDRAGTIQSFNFNGGTGMYLRNLNYAICIRPALDTCRTQFTALDNMSFRVGTGTTTPQQDCTTDYVVIPESGSMNPMDATRSKLCGNMLPNMEGTGTALMSYVISRGKGPIVVQFRSDNVVTVAADEIGFRLSYQQMATGCNTLLA